MIALKLRVPLLPAFEKEKKNHMPHSACSQKTRALSATCLDTISPHALHLKPKLCERRSAVIVLPTIIPGNLVVRNGKRNQRSMVSDSVTVVVAHIIRHKSALLQRSSHATCAVKKAMVSAIARLIAAHVEKRSTRKKIRRTVQANCSSAKIVSRRVTFLKTALLNHNQSVKCAN